MKQREKNAEMLREELFQRYPQLTACMRDIDAALERLRTCYERGGKVLLAGNGGSAADCEHISGELMKSFLFRRAPERAAADRLSELYGNEGEELSCLIEGALPAISLTSMTSANTAFTNDVGSAASLAQLVNGLGRKGDVFFGISTSGNSHNIYLALMMARAREMQTILLTGGDGGRCAMVADTMICVPEKETFKIQELHLPVYHALCAILEAELFEERKN